MMYVTLINLTNPSKTTIWFQGFVFIQRHDWFHFYGSSTWCMNIFTVIFKCVLPTKCEGQTGVQMVSRPCQYLYRVSCTSYFCVWDLFIAFVACMLPYLLLDLWSLDCYELFGLFAGVGFINLTKAGSSRAFHLSLNVWFTTVWLH
jgi:hypothetical protein